MITKNDCLILLSELNTRGVNTSNEMKQLMKSNDIDISILEFINSHMQLDLGKFYEKIRKSYNNKKSNLYINIVKEDYKEPKDVLTTLASLNLQILLYNKNVDNPKMFLRHARFEEIQTCMLNYYKTGDLIPCQKLLRLVKADLKVLEELNRGTL